MNEPGFLRLIATAEIDGRTYRGVGTAGFAPERIQPTQVNPPDFDAFWDARTHPARGAADRCEVDAAAGLRHGRRGLLADQPAERRADRRHEPAVRHPLHAPRGRQVSGRCSASRRRRAAVPRAAGTRRARPDHLADRHPRHPGDPAAGGLRQPGERRPERLPHLRPRFARALLLSTRLHRDAARQRFPDVAAAVGRTQSRRDRRQPGRRAGDRHRRARPARHAAGGATTRRSPM